MAERTEGKPIPARNNAMAVALSLAKRGWPVFPVNLVPVTRADGTEAVDKRPLVKWLEGATTDLEQIATWWGADFPTAWVGVHAERAGIVVVDLDIAKGDKPAGADALKAAGIDLPKTFHYATRSGGEHHVYAAPKGRALTIARDTPEPGVDIRAGHGLMVYYGPPILEAPRLAPAPEWSLVDSQRSGERAADGDIEAWLSRALDGKPRGALKRIVKRTDWAGLAHDDMLGKVSDLVKRGGERGAATAYRRARDAYTAGRPDRGRDWDNAARGSIGRHGLPLVTFPLSRAERDAIRARNAAPAEPRVEPIALSDCDDTFIAWLGLEYDLDALHVMLAIAVGERLPGDPAWGLLLSGSGFTKTETVQAVGGRHAHIVSSIASEGALLSATSQGERSKDATGGLLREIGAAGTLVIKDVTSILSMDRTARGQVLAALREIYDGRWKRNVGTDGGRSLEWSGRIVILGAVTTAWDRAHEVIASMGDRFLLVRMDSTKGRIAAGRKAISNTGSEETMRAELAAAAAGVLAGADLDAAGPDDHETDRILRAADVVTRARTAVDLDYRGNVVDSHAPEAPTRFAKQLAQVFRGAVAIGLSRDDALALAIRCARDSMPPLRLEILEDVAAHEWTRTSDVMKRLQKPRATVDRQLQALHLLELVTVDEEIAVAPFSQRETTTWRYSLAEGVDITSLNTPNPTE